MGGQAWRPPETACWASQARAQQGLEGLGRETEARAQAEPTCSAVRATAQSSTRKQAFPTGEPRRTPRLLSAGLGPWASPLPATAQEVPRAHGPEIPAGASFPPLNRSSFPRSCRTPWPCGRGGAAGHLPQAPGGSCGPDRTCIPQTQLAGGSVISDAQSALGKPEAGEGDRRVCVWCVGTSGWERGI